MKYFSAANSGNGFFSLYDEFPDDGVYLHIIKGGAGTGKSGFMRKIAAEAEKRGMETEQILCSGDPSSLDALYIPALHTAWMDGTAPHAREPELFGVNSDYVNLGAFCATPFSKADSERARAVSAGYKEQYREAYKLLSAAAGLKEEADNGDCTDEQKKQLMSFAAGLLGNAEASGQKERGKNQRRFISAISCRGRLFLTDTIKELCKQCYVISGDPTGLCLRYIARYARNRGCAVTECPDPLIPARPEAIIIPELHLCFTTLSIPPSEDCECISAEAPLRPVQGNSEESMKLQSLSDELIASACGRLREAKLLHDRLEAISAEYMDYNALNAFTELRLNGLFKN